MTSDSEYVVLDKVYVEIVVHKFLVRNFIWEEYNMLPFKYFKKELETTNVAIM